MPIAKERILFEDDYLLVVNKLPRELAVEAGPPKPGQPGHSTPGKHTKESLFDFLRKDYPGLRVLHRLDYGTSGVMAFGKTAAVSDYVREKHFGGWKKTYVALVAGHMRSASGTIDKKLKARTKDVEVEAVSHYRVLQAFPFATLVEVKIDTGRKHQIRQHLQSIGHPLLCDPLYGDAKADRNFTKHMGYRHFFLHAAKLSFPHPMLGVTVDIEAPMPKSFNDAVKRMRAASTDGR